MRTLLLVFTGCLLILSGPMAYGKPNDPIRPAGTSEYIFIADQSTVLQTGGIAGIHRTYTITGTFQLTVDSKAGTALFHRVDANATDDSSYKRTLDPNQVFNLTALAGRVVDETSIRFEGKADDGSSVLITLTFADGTVTLKGQTTPPPNSADFFLFTLDAVALRRYAGATSVYVFQPDHSTIIKTGGMRPQLWTCRIEGQFRLTVDSEARTASFDHVDANATDDSSHNRTLDPNEVFNMAGLAGRVVDETTIRFEGKAHDGSSVVITLTFADSAVTLKGQTTPPPNSADFFLFALDAVAQRKHAGGTGEPNDPYQIATAADLIALGETPEDYDKHFLLTADIDLDPNLPGRKVFDKAVIAPNCDTRFVGAFDGNGHTISHLTIMGEGNLGLFGGLGSRAEVRDVGVVDVNVTGSGYDIGGLVGSNWGDVAECYSTGEVSGTGSSVGGLVGDNSDSHSVIDPDWDGTITTSYSTGVVNGESYVGGLVGSNSGYVTECYSASEVSGSGSSVGGLVGYNIAHFTISYIGSESIGTITMSYSTGAVDGNDGVGGLVGYNYQGTLTQSYSTGVVCGGSDVGGLVGANDCGTVTNSYSTGGVSGSGGVGGLAGSNGGTVSRCYSTGPVTGSGHYIGGLVGGPLVWFSEDSLAPVQFRRNGTVEQCVWDTQTSGQATSDGGTGKTTAEMQMASTFLDAGWDFVGETANGTEDIWWILEGQDYPRLAWERVLSDDFGDGKAEPLWMLYEPEPDIVHIREVNGRLEVEAVAQTEDIDAIYVAKGWRLDATKDFALRVDFHFGKRGVGDGRVTLGVVPGLDPSGLQWAELEAGCFDTDPFYLYEVRDGPWVQEQVTSRSSDEGTLYLSYNPDADELYFSYTGYGKANAWQTVPGLLKGRWAGEPVYVILSGGSEGMALNAGDAWLDNFVLNAGVLAPNTSAQE